MSPISLKLPLVFPPIHSRHYPLLEIPIEYRHLPRVLVVQVINQGLAPAVSGEARKVLHRLVREQNEVLVHTDALLAIGTRLVVGEDVVALSRI